MVDYVGMLKEMVEKYKGEVKNIERAVKILKRAGEDTTALELKLTQIKEMIERYERAIREEEGRE